MLQEDIDSQATWIDDLKEAHKLTQGDFEDLALQRGYRRGFREDGARWGAGGKKTPYLVQQGIRWVTQAGEKEII